MSTSTKPLMKIELSAWQKMIAIAEAAKPNEVLALILGRAEENNLLVTDLFIPNQEVTGGHCAMKTDKLLTDFMIEHSGEVIGWWHSHVNMGTFYSGEDNQTLNNFGADEVQYAVGLVFSLPNEIKGWLKIFKPIELDKIELNVSVRWNQDEEIIKLCEEQVKQRVANKPVTYYQNCSNMYDYMGIRRGGGGFQRNFQEAQSETKDGGNQENFEPLSSMIDANCEDFRFGRKKKPYCVHHGALVCGTIKCHRFEQQKAMLPKPDNHTGCKYASNPVVRNGECGCLGLTYDERFVSCKECGLYSLQGMN